MEELMDVYLHFQLYYSDDLQKMQDWKKSKTKKKKTKTRKVIKKKIIKKKKEKEKKGDDGEEGGEEGGKKCEEGEEEKEEEDEEEEEIEEEIEVEEEVEVEEDIEDENVDDDNEEETNKDAAQARKLPKKRDLYTICKDNGLGALTKRFGLLPEQFAENLRDNYQRHETEQFPQEPEELAEQYICT